VEKGLLKFVNFDVSFRFLLLEWVVC